MTLEQKIIQAMVLLKEILEEVHELKGEIEDNPATDPDTTNVVWISQVRNKYE